MKYFAIATLGLIAAQSDLLHAETQSSSGNSGQKEFTAPRTPSGEKVYEQEGSATKFLQTSPIVSAAGLYDETSNADESGVKTLGDMKDPVYSDEGAADQEKTDGAGSLMATALSIGIALVTMA